MDSQGEYFEREDNITDTELSDDERIKRNREKADAGFYNQSSDQQNYRQNSSYHRQNFQTNNTRSQNRQNTRQRSTRQNNEQNNRNFQQNQQCRSVFGCGHRCERQKHRSGRHNQNCPNCQRDLDPCLRELKCGHQCQSLVRYNPCPPCEQEITKILQCEHELIIKCKQKNDEFLCKIKMSQMLPCDHEVWYICQERQSVLCNQPCERLLRCDHQCNLICREDCSTAICKEGVLKQLECQHFQFVECYTQQQNTICLQRCDQRLECGHLCKAFCQDKCPDDFHDFCEDSQCDSNYYDLEQSIVLDNLIQKYNCYYQTDIKINIEIRREVDIEINIFKQLFKDKIELLMVNSKYQSYQRKLIKYLQRDDLYVDDQQFKFMKDLTLNLIRSHYTIKKHQIDQFNEYSEIQQYKLFNYYLGKMICKQKLKCGHLCEQFFHLNECICQIQQIILIRKCGHKIITGCHNREYTFLSLCNQICNKRLPCDHLCQKLCNQVCVCEQMISVNKQGCNHQIRILCGSKQFAQTCYQMKTITLRNCSHTLQVMCYDYTEYQCESFISYQCVRCENITQIKCKDIQNFKCNQQMKIDLPNCRHQKLVLCRDTEISLECQELIYNICVSCEDIYQISCKDKLNYQCQNKITKTYYRCTHYQQVSCYQQNLFANCKIEVTLCQHQQKIECYQGIQNCQKICGKLLQCNHLCKMKCRIQCICYEKIKYTLNCGHTKEKFCYQQSLVVCDEICNKKLKCTHLCKQSCIEQCKCLQMVEHIFACGHKISIQCEEQTNLLICQQFKSITLPCSHKQIRYCKDKTFQKCKVICNKTLPCGDNCQQQCHQQCKCIFDVYKTYPCQHFFEGCSKLIPQNCQQQIKIQRECGHQIWKLCSDQITLCLEKCSKVLQCKHQCQDQCGIKCQVKCNQCIKDQQRNEQLNLLQLQNQLSQQLIANKSDEKIVNSKIIIQEQLQNKCQNAVEQTNYLFGSMVFQSDFQLVNEKDVNQSQMFQNKACNKILKFSNQGKQIGQPCQSNQTVIRCQSCLNKIKMECKSAENILCINLIEIQCKLCKQESMIICGGQLQCRCTKQNLYKNSKSCKVILSCNHLCGGTLCTSNFHELCSYQSICQHKLPVYCSGRSPCQLCDPSMKQQYQTNIQNYGSTLSTIKDLIFLKNTNYEKNRNLLQKIAKDDKLPYLINSAYHRFIQLKLYNLIAYYQEDKKIFLNISKYSKMERIEKSDFYLTSQQLKDL